MSTAVLAQQPVARPFSNGGTNGTQEMTGFTAYGSPDSTVSRNLEDGAMVVMYSGPGELIIVRPNGRYYDLEAISTTEEPEELTLQFFPSVAIFTVIKKGKYLGFKSVAAEGRTLQAVAADESVPLRVNNFNFGAWECWEQVGTGFVNKKWPQRLLNLDVREIQSVAVEDLRRLERHNLKMSRDKVKQIKTLELKNQEIKRQLQEQNRARKRMSMQHQREQEDLRSRLEEALREKRRLEVDAVQTGARLKQKELQFQKLTLQRDTAVASLEQVEANQRAHERDLEMLKEKHRDEIEGLKRQHNHEIEALKRDKEHAMGRSTQMANGEATLMQQKYEQAVEEKERELRRVCVEHAQVLQQKMNEINSLRDENARLASALHTIRDQLTRGFVAINSSEMVPSRAGAGSGMDMPVGGYHRFSPVPSRASTGRRPDDNDGPTYYGLGDNAITPRRGSLPCAPTSPYGRLSPSHSPEPFQMRGLGELSRPRRGDSRLSDNTGLGRVSDDYPPSYRRPGSGFARSHRLSIDHLNSRYSSQLDSVEDRSFAREESEYEDDVAENEVAEQKEDNDDAKKPQLDDNTVESEESLSMEATKQDPEDVLSDSDGSEADAVSETSDSPQSWVGEDTPVSQQSALIDSVESDKDSKLDEE